MSNFNLPIFQDISNFKDPIFWHGITIHHSLTKDQQVKDWIAIRNYHKSLGWVDIGYHAGIEKVNDKYEYQIGRPLNMQGAHERKVNNTCIGICVVGNFDLVPPNATQLWLLACLCRAYMTRFGFGVESVNFHRDYKNKSCPGRLFDKNIVRDIIKGIE